MLGRTITVALAAFAFSAGIATAQDTRSSRTIVTTDDGRQFTRDAIHAGRPGNRSGTVTWTGPEGRSTTRDYQRSWDRQNGYQRNSTITGPQGRTRNVVGSGRRVAPGVFEGRRTVRGFNGRTRGWNWRRVRN